MDKGKKMIMPNFDKKKLLACVRCGKCRSVCPILPFKGYETYSARGKMVTIDAYLNNLLAQENSQYFVDRIYDCLLCGHCKVVCPSGLDTTHILKEMRTHFVNSELSIPSPVVKFFSRDIDETGNIFNFPKEDRNIWMEGQTNFNIKKDAKILYFVGCISSILGKPGKTARSFVQILNKADIDFTILGEDEICCGNPYLLLGDNSTAKKLALQNVTNILKKGADLVVTSCPGCYKTFKQEYPILLGEKMDFEVKHASEFIMDLIDNRKISFKKSSKSITYHDPCELGRYCGVYEAPRKILENIPSLKFVEMPYNKESSHCCGGGGGFKVVNPDLSLEIALNRLKEAESIGVQTISSLCPACDMNLLEASLKYEKKIGVVDLIELVLELMD